MSDSKKKQANSKKAQMQKKASVNKKNNKNNIETSGYAADNEDIAAQTKSAASKNKNKNRSPKKIEESSEEESSSSSEKQTSVASTSTSLNNNNANSNTAAHPQSNGTHDQSEQERKKKKKKHKRNFGKWRPFQRQEVIDSDDSADSEEERSYIRSIRERVTLEEFERKATRELREKIEQARINRRFFLSARRTPEQQAKHIKMQHLIHANLFNPPREYVVDEKHLVDYDVNDKALQAEALRALTLEDDEQLVTFDNRFAPLRDDELAVPTFRDISNKYSDTYLGYDAVQTDLYWSTYQAEYIVYDTDPIEMEVEPPLFQDKMPRRKHHSDASLRRASSAGVTSDKVTRVSKFFHPHRWSKLELDWVRALLVVYGAEWPVISKLMCRAKLPPALQSAYVRSGGVLDEHHVTVQSMEVICGLCQQPRDNKRMVFCTCCDRAYHLKCLDPPMSRIPNEWFCSPMCASVIKMKCELCDSASDDDKMLLCDGCDHGYHMYCLPTPLTAVPEGDWFCPKCAQSRGLVTPITATESRVESSTAPITAESSEARVLPLIPIKCVLNTTQHTTAPRSVIHKHWLLTQFSLLAESVPLCPQHTTPHSSQPWLPLKQPPVLALHESATQLLHSARITYSQLRHLRQYCTTCLLHAAVELLPGASIDLSRIPVPDRSIFTQRIRPTERTLEALRTHFTHHIQACVAAVDRVQRDSLKKTPKSTPKSHSLKLSKKQRRVSFAEEDLTPPVTRVKPTLKRRKSEGDAYKKEYARKKRAPLDEPAELPAPTVGRPRVKVSPATPREDPTDGYEDGAPRYWVFQANPEYYDIDTSLKELTDMTWLVKQQTGKIHNGDKVFIWEAGKLAGVRAVGSVTSEPAEMDELPAMAKYARIADLGAKKELRCKVHVDYVLPTRIAKATVRATPTLSQITLLRAPIGTNFRITRDQAYRLESLVLKSSAGEFSALYDHSGDKDEENKSDDNNNNNTNTTEGNGEKKEDSNNNNNNNSNNNNTENNTNVMPNTETKNSTDHTAQNSNGDVEMKDREEKVTPVKHESVDDTIDLNQAMDSETNNSNTKYGNTTVNNVNINNSPPRNTEANNSSSPPSRKRQHEVTADDTSPNKRRRTLPRAATQRRVFNADDFLPDEAFTEEMMRDLEGHVTPATDKKTPVKEAPVAKTKTPVKDTSAKKRVKETPVKEKSVQETPVKQAPVTEDVKEAPVTDNTTPVKDTESVSASVDLTPVTPSLPLTQSLDTDVDLAVACVICKSRDTSVQVKHVTGSMTFPQELLKCHACQEQYHTHCVVPSITARSSLPLDTHHWLCPHCGLTHDELTRVRNALVLLELHYELRRMLREECDQIYFSMKQLINSASETNEVTSALQTRVTALEELTRDATRAVTESYRAWNSSL